MDISPEHEADRVEVSRLPALYASLARLQQSDPEGLPATLAIYGGARPQPGGVPEAAPIVTLSLVSTAGTINDELIELYLATPISSQITGADETAGTVPTWARVADPAGGWWADCSVTVDGGGGELEMPQTGEENGTPVARLYNGATAYVTSATIRG